jgi:hypothetical protein
MFNSSRPKISKTMTSYQEVGKQKPKMHPKLHLAYWY